MSAAKPKKIALKRDYIIAGHSFPGKFYRRGAPRICKHNMQDIGLVFSFGIWNTVGLIKVPGI
jgi:hypothetical protein